ncbi:hypothetical protein ASF27_01705 [Methylobacterium sp. Leaf102]|nr:hypothetical protein ASF27_01705 [Methylobacterium sp. Leaf102]
MQKAITDVLTANANVAARVGGRIFDEVPNDGTVAPPYVYLGPINRRRVPHDCAQIWTITARLYVISAEFGRQEAWDAIEAVVQALDGADAPDLEFAAPFSIQEPLRVTQAGDVIDPLALKSVFLDLTTTIARES